MIQLPGVLTPLDGLVFNQAVSSGTGPGVVGTGVVAVHGQQCLSASATCVVRDGSGNITHVAPTVIEMVLSADTYNCLSANAWAELPDDSLEYTITITGTFVEQPIRNF
jgi:hypothetical protein